MPEIAKEMLEYCIAFLDKSFFWLGLLMLIGDLLEQFIPAVKSWLERLIPVWAFRCLVALCFFLATFQVWHEEHRSFLIEKKKEEPLLIPVVFDKIIGKIEGDPILHSSVLLRVAVKNTGAPSVVNNWQLLIDGYPQARCGRVKIPDTLTLPRERNQPPYVFHSDQAIYEKVETSPIATGAGPRGIIWFSCDLSSDVVRNSSGRFRVQDVNGTWWEAKIVAGPLQQNQPYYPGMDNH